MGLRSSLKKHAVSLSTQAVERLFADEKRAARISSALGSVQRGKQAVDSTQRAVMHQLSFATKADFKDLGKQLSALKKRLKALDEKLTRVR
jgi:hypothetical protein